ncbi:hypothetical protein [Nostoc sp.]|uniref:hypothetical protein n=1 Tax=Nostoc sp. TaxID=1180 RepID=UPI002FF6A875
MLDHHFLAMALTCQFPVWDIADLGDRTYLNLVSNYIRDYTCDQFLALFTKSSDRKSEKLHPPKICSTLRWRDKAKLLQSWRTHLLIWRTHLLIWRTHLLIWRTHLLIWRTHLLI